MPDAKELALGVEAEDLLCGAACSAMPERTARADHCPRDDLGSIRGLTVALLLAAPLWYILLVAWSILG